MKRTKVVDAFDASLYGTKINVKGWVRTRRGNKHVNFIALNDGSTIKNIQVVVDLSKFTEAEMKPITTGACISVIGTLVESQGKGQQAEIQAESIELYGGADPDVYPLQKKGHTLEFLREIAHLRPRTNTFGAVFRIRHHLAYAIHKYFNDRGFFYLNTPLITASDCEGARCHVSGNDARPQQRAPYRRWCRRLQRRLLRQTHQPHRVGSARG